MTDVQYAYLIFNNKFEFCTEKYLYRKGIYCYFINQIYYIVMVFGEYGNYCLYI